MTEKKTDQKLGKSLSFLTEFTILKENIQVQILPLHEMGVPTAELVPDPQRYFDIHHTAEDTFEKVNRRELLTRCCGNDTTYLYD
jgi:hypothetical protein